MRRSVVHFRLGGERPACRPTDWTGFARPNLSERIEDVTCKRCRAQLIRTGEKLVALKEKR